MFYCQITNKLSKSGQKPERITIATRPKEYSKRVRNEESNKWEDVFVAKGWEIVQELNCSEEGAQLWASWSQEEKSSFVSANYPHLLKFNLHQ